MKKLCSFRLTFVVSLALISIISCKKEDPAVLPVVSTTPATNITVSTATSGGTITSDGGATITAAGVCWGTNSNPSTNDSKTVDGTNVGQFVSNLTGLSAGTTYHVRAYATNSVGTGYGADISFSTLGKVPAAITQAASEVTSTGATLTGTVNPNDLSTTVTFEYGTTTNYGSTATAIQSPVVGNSMVNVTVVLSGLTPGTTYHYRIKTVNPIGTTYGEDVSFTTVGLPPTAITQAACCMSPNGATLNGTVNANGLSTTVTFEFGVTTSYGNTVTATQSPLVGTTNSVVSAPLTGLLPSMIYHFRIKATNSQGTVYGADMTFTTQGQAPTVSILPATNITTNSAALNGTVNPNNQSTTVVFEYGTSTNYGNNQTASQNPVAGTANTNVNANISGLIAGIIYHYRIRATNSTGTTYSSDATFTYTIADVEGSVYKTVTIGTQIWMAENLKTERYNNGDLIPNITGDSQWNATTTGAYCYLDNNENTYRNLYGVLYNWFAVNDSKRLCPTGWHVPTNTDWTTLGNYLGGFSQAGGSLKESGTLHWIAPNVGATNVSGFTALPGGFRQYRGNFGGHNDTGNFWSSSDDGGVSTSYWQVASVDAGLHQFGNPKQEGYAVRCIKD